jgi:hypothetical protein
MTAQLETYIPLKEAAKKYGIPPKALTRLVEDGIIRLSRTEEGDRVITKSTVDNEAAARIILNEIHPEQYECLQGDKIRVAKAGQQYGVEYPNLIRWADRGYICVRDRGFQRLELDAADAKYVADVFKRAKELTGSSIKAGWVLRRVLSETSKPSELKHKDSSMVGNT